MNRILRNILVLTTAKMSRPFDIFLANIWVIVNREIMKTKKNSNEKIPNAVLMTKNQKEKPAVTAIDLKRGDDNCNFKSDKWMRLDLIATRLLHQLMQLVKLRLETCRIFVY